MSKNSKNRFSEHLGYIKHHVGVCLRTLQFASVESHETDHNSKSYNHLGDYPTYADQNPTVLMHNYIFGLILEQQIADFSIIQ